jgi:hypothetical protein
MADEDSRPSKRAKTSQHNSDARKLNTKNKTKHRGGQSRNTNQQSDSKGDDRRQPVFSASGLHSDDVGIFVTSDKGQEKRCLQELSDLLSEVCHFNLEDVILG